MTEATATAEAPAPALAPASAAATPAVSTILSTEADASEAASPDSPLPLAAEGKGELGAKEEKTPAPVGRPMPPADASPDQLAAWRKEQGLPAEASGYLDKLPGGLVIGEIDKPLVLDFANSMHAKHAPPELVHEAIGWFYRAQDADRAARADLDGETRTTNTQALKKEWGPQFGRKLRAINGMLDRAPEGVKDLLWGARLADGTLLGDHAGALQWLDGVAAQVNPAGSVMPATGHTTNALEDEIRGWEAKMANKHSDYWTGPNAETNQARLRDLYRAREKVMR